MSLTGAGRVAITTNHLVTFQRCPWAWVNNIAVALDGAYPAPALDEPMRELMGGTAEAHRKRVARSVADLHGVDSVMAFSHYRENPEKSEPKSAILEYNRVDCLSMKRLHEWLVGLQGN